MNVKPQIGGVLGGGGEATQYFIVCENKPLFEVNSFKSGLFFCYIVYVLVAYPLQAFILEQPDSNKKNCRFLGICV